jgi:D-alanyl-D-alanine dipeptidase
MADARALKKLRKNSVVEPISEINKIEIVDNGDPMVELNTYCPNIVIGANWRTGAKQVLYARLKVADMLNKAAQYLPKGYKLDVFSAFRSVADQIEIYNRVYRRYKRRHKGAPKSVLRRLTNRFVHPPDIKTPPGHATGGCIDLGLIGPDGKQINMTKPFKWRTPKSRGVAATYAEDLHPDAKKHRKMLIDAMTKAGFTNYAGEWWHWSYGDSCWAWRLGKKTAIYGIAQLSLEQQKKRERASRSISKKSQKESKTNKKKAI